VDEALAADLEEDHLAEEVETVALEEDQLQDDQLALHQELQYNDKDHLNKGLNHVSILKAVVDWDKVQVNLEQVLNLKVDWDKMVNLKVRMDNRVD